MKISALFGLAVVLCSGCASFTPEPISPAVAITRFELRTLDNPDLRAFIQSNIKNEIESWPLPQWDVDLLTLAAFYYHPDLDVARAKWNVAQAGIESASMRPNPSVSLGSQRNADAPSGTSPWTFGWNLDIPIETAGKRGYRTAQARYLSESARLAIAGSAWQVRSRVRSALVDVFFARQVQEVLSQQQSLLQNNLTLREHRFALGMASQPEVTQARIALNQATLASVDTQRLQAEARVTLASALGMSSKAIDNIALAPKLFADMPALPTDDIRQQALLNRADVLGALADYAASQSALQLEISKQYPNASLGSGYSWDAGASKWSLGLMLVLPIAHQNQGPIAEARARRLQARANFNARQAQAIGEIDTALASYRAVQNKLAASNALLADQDTQMRSAMASFKAGQTDKVSLLGAQLEISQLVVARLDARTKAQQALGLLEDALQRPLNAPVLSTPALQENIRQTKENKL